MEDNSFQVRHWYFPPSLLLAKNQWIKEWWHLECLEMHYGYPEALQVACLGLSVRFSSQTEKKKLALSRGRTGWIQAKGSGLGWEGRKQRREKSIWREERDLFKKNNLWTRERFKMRGGKNSNWVLISRKEEELEGELN